MIECSHSEFKVHLEEHFNKENKKNPKGPKDKKRIEFMFKVLNHLQDKKSDL